MSILVDTNVLAGAWLERDAHDADAARALDLAVQGVWGPLWVSDYIVDEAVTLVRYRARNHGLADELAAYLLGEAPNPVRFRLARIGPQDFAAARAAFRQYRDRLLSFTDCTSIVLVQSLGLRGVLSADRGFDGLVHRIDPAVDGSLAAAP